jgi:hypothetical protein
LYPKKECSETKIDDMGDDTYLLENVQKELEITKKKLHQTDMELRRSSELIKEKELTLKEFKQRYNSNIYNLNLQINKLSSDLYEMEYHYHKGRTIKQRLETKFYMVYLLTKKKNRGIKNALINIRGYRAIKNKQLLDVGYYLKNNHDIRLAGDDPIMQYIYYGYKEGRKPNPNFDGDYYIKENADLKNLNINPLVHYSLYGLKEGRKTINKSQTK